MVKGIDIEVTVSFSGKRAGANLWQNAMADACNDSTSDSTSKEQGG